MKYSDVRFWVFISGWMANNTLSHLLRGEFWKLWVDIPLLSFCVWFWIREERE